MISVVASFERPTPQLIFFPFSLTLHQRMSCFVANKMSFLDVSASCEVHVIEPFTPGFVSYLVKCYRIPSCSLGSHSPLLMVNFLDVNQIAT